MTTSITLRVELFGLARHLTGERAVDLDLPPGARLRDAVRELAARYPALVGPVIAESCDRLVELHVFNVDGITVPEDTDVPLSSGQTVCLIFVVQGG